MANKNGHWYTDKNGNHYFVEEGQTPQEGWEASKRRKMINGGKYQVSEDGNEYRDVEKDEYDKFEADDASFDDNIDDDFGFDDEEDDFEEEERVRYLDKTYNRYFDSQENWKRNETGNYEIGDDENYGYVLNDGERPGMIRAGRVRNGDHEHPEEEFFEDPQEAKEWVEEVANGEYNREMQRAQEQNAAMSEGQDDDFNKGQTVDAPEKGEGWKKTKMASGTLYEGPNGERYMDDGSAPEKVKIGAKEMTKDEWKDWYHKLDDNNREMGREFLLNHASEFNMSENEMKAFLDGGSQTNEYNYKHPGHYNKDGSWKPSNHETKEWAPKYFGVYEKRNPDGIGYTGKEYRGDFPSLEEAKEFASKYKGNNELMIGEFENQGNGGYRNINNQKYVKPMTNEQRQAIREQINKMVASLDDARSLDEAWDIEEGIKELEDMLKKYKGK